MEPAFLKFIIPSPMSVLTPVKIPICLLGGCVYVYKCIIMNNIPIIDFIQVLVY